MTEDYFREIGITSLNVFAITLHEMYESFLAAGFDEVEAFQLTNNFMLESIRIGGQQHEE